MTAQNSIVNFSVPTKWVSTPIVLLVIVAALPAPTALAQNDRIPTTQSAVGPGADDPLQKKATWQVPNASQVAAQLDAWHEDSQLTGRQIRMANQAFLAPQETAAIGADDRLNRVIGAIAAVRPDVAKIDKQLSPQSQSVLPPTFSHILDNESELPFVRDHLRLLVGRWLAQNQFFDEALEQLGKVELSSVVAPESVLFYRAMAEHQLLKSSACQQSIDLLLEHEDRIPLRFAVMAKVMSADLSPVQDGSLDEVSRLMKDVYRRTKLLRSGVIVLEAEREVIKKLDSLIEQAQQQQQQASQQNTPSDSQRQGASPMEDSQAAGGFGDGKATSKSIVDGGQWGDLPPAERAAAMAEMVKDMPPHYRAAIETYFRRLAQEDNQ